MNRQKREIVKANMQQLAYLNERIRIVKKVQNYKLPSEFRESLLTALKEDAVELMVNQIAVKYGTMYLPYHVKKAVSIRTMWQMCGMSRK